MWSQCIPCPIVPALLTLVPINKSGHKTRGSLSNKIRGAHWHNQRSRVCKIKLMLRLFLLKQKSCRCSNIVFFSWTVPPTLAQGRLSIVVINILPVWTKTRSPFDVKFPWIYIYIGLKHSNGFTNQMYPLPLKPQILKGNFIDNCCFPFTRSSSIAITNEPIVSNTTYIEFRCTFNDMQFRLK